MSIRRWLGWSLICVMSMCWGAVAHADVVDLEASDNATVQPAGPRTGVNGKRFFNIEGNDFGTFASYGVADFDLSAVAETGVEVTDLTLKMTQSLAAFSANGLLNFYVSTATGTDIQPGTSPLFFDAAELPDGIGSQLDTLYWLGSGTFTIDASGVVDTFNFALSGAAAGYVANQLANGDWLRIVVSPGEDGVAATYAGFNNANFDGPLLSLTTQVAIPEPGVFCVLLTIGASLVCYRRRKG